MTMLRLLGSSSEHYVQHHLLLMQHCKRCRWRARILMMMMMMQRPQALPAYDALHYITLHAPLNRRVGTPIRSLLLLLLLCTVAIFYVVTLIQMRSPFCPLTRLFRRLKQRTSSFRLVLLMFLMTMRPFMMSLSLMSLSMHGTCSHFQLNACKGQFSPYAPVAAVAVAAAAGMSPEELQSSGAADAAAASAALYLGL
jgi:hypothetical protein